MFKIIYNSGNTFTVVAPDGATFEGVYDEPCFFTWQDKEFVATTPYFHNETQSTVNQLTPWKTTDVDGTLGLN